MNLSSKLLNNQIFKTVGKAADNLGVDCYVVGGYVRDILLNRPGMDIDFVCVGSGIKLAGQVAQSLGGLVISRYFSAALHPREVSIQSSSKVRASPSLLLSIVQGSCPLSLD